MHGAGCSRQLDSETFNVVVQDTTGPEFGPTPDVPLQGNVVGGYQGAAYTLPTATDLVTGGVTDLECDPLPGAMFPLGDTTVDCTATDGNNNTTEADFDVTVVDTTGPLFQTPPGVVTVQAQNLNTGTPAGNSCITRFLNVMVTDLVDASPTLTHDAPNMFPVGSTTVTFTAADASGNVSTATGVVNVAPGDQGPCTVDRRPPRNPKKVSVRTGSKLVKLCWKQPTNPDFWRVQIYESGPPRQGSGPRSSRVTADASATAVFETACSTCTACLVATTQATTRQASRSWLRRAVSSCAARAPTVSSRSASRNCSSGPSGRARALQPPDPPHAQPTRRPEQVAAEAEVHAPQEVALQRSPKAEAGPVHLVRLARVWSKEGEQLRQDHGARPLPREEEELEPARPRRAEEPA